MEEVEKILERGVVRLIPEKEKLAKLLKSGKKLTIYNGIDPSAAILHLGHAVILRKLRQFQDLGHKIILLIGDFTGRIGDPTGKVSARKPLSAAQVKQNAKDYKLQAAKILKFAGENPCEIRYNNQWLSKLTLAEIIKVASNFTVQQLIEREMFQARLKEGKPIWLHEFLYPLLQGYDSVAMAVDMEVGGVDQTFNMLIGRELVKIYCAKEKFVLTVPLLTGIDGQKMGKSENNYIALNEAAGTMYQKIMSIPDNLITEYFTLTTDLPLEKISNLEGQLKSGKTHPLQVKKMLAAEIVGQYHDQNEAKVAKVEFERVFQKGQLPVTIKTITRSKKNIKAATIAQITHNVGLAKSVNQAKQVIRQGGLMVNDKIILNPQQHLGQAKNYILKRANYQIIKITVDD